jgi:hypothetical protein
VGVLFYLKPDGQYILADADGMAVFLFIVIMQNTAMIVSLTQICCPSDLKKKRTPTVYQNVT